MVAGNEDVKTILHSKDTDLDGPTLPTRAELAADSSSPSSFRSLSQVLCGLPSHDNSLREDSVSGTVLEKRSSMFTSRAESISSPTLRLQERVSSVRLSQRYGMESTQLQEWLERHHLGEIYTLLAAVGFEDVESILARPKGWSQEELVHMGIAKPGHRMRLLMALDEEAGRFTRPPPVRVFAAAKPQLPCCGVPFNSSTFSITLSHPLRDWLRLIKLDHLFDRFQSSGYDNLQDLVHMLVWRVPLTDEVLQRDIGISKPGHRARILSRLQDCLKGTKDPDPILEPGNGPNAACSTCLCM